MITIEHLSEPLAKAMGAATPEQQHGFLRFLLRFADPTRPVSMYRADAESAKVIIPFLTEGLGFEDGKDVKAEPARGSVRIIWPDTSAVTRLASGLSKAGVGRTDIVSKFFTEGADGYIRALSDAPVCSAAVRPGTSFPDLAAASDKTTRMLVAEYLETCTSDVSEKIPDGAEHEVVRAFCTCSRDRWNAGHGDTPMFPPLAMMEALLRVTGRIDSAPRFSLRHASDVNMTPHMLARPLRYGEKIPSMWLPVGSTLPSECYAGDKRQSASANGSGLVKYLAASTGEYKNYAEGGGFLAALIVGDALLRQDPDTVKAVARTREFWEYVKTLILKWLEIGGATDLDLATNKFSRIALGWGVPSVSDRSRNYAGDTSRDIISDIGLPVRRSPEPCTGDEYTDAAAFASFAFLALPVRDYSSWNYTAERIHAGEDIEVSTRAPETDAAPIPALAATDLPSEWFAMVHGDFWKKRGSLYSERLEQLRDIRNHGETILDRCSASTPGHKAGGMKTLCDGVLAVFADAGVPVKVKTSSCPGPLRNPDLAVTAVYSGMTSVCSAADWNRPAAGDVPDPGEFPPFSTEFDGGSVLYSDTPIRLGGTPLPPEEVTRRLAALEEHPEIMMRCAKREGHDAVPRAAWAVMETNIDAKCLDDVRSSRLMTLKAGLIKLCSLTLVCGETDPLAFATDPRFVRESLAENVKSALRPIAPTACPETLFGEGWDQAMTSLPDSPPRFGMTLSHGLDGRLVIAFSISCDELNPARVMFRHRVGLPLLSEWMRKKLKSSRSPLCVTSEGPGKCVVPEGMAGHDLAVALLGHIVRTFPSYLDLTADLYGWSQPEPGATSPYGGFTPLVARVRGDSGRYSGYGTHRYAMTGCMIDPDSHMPEFI